jgi:thiol-disulfide isomerase/thioredoxin
MFRKIAPAVLVLLILAGCSDRNGFRISGKINGHPGETVFLKKVDVNVSVPFDSVKIKSDGSFRFKDKATEPEFYELGIAKNDFITLLAQPGDKIKLSFQGKDLTEGFTVEGSAETSKMVMLDSALASTRQKIRSLQDEYNRAASVTGSTEKQASINEEYRKVLKDQRMFNISFILKNLRYFSSVKALYQMIDDNNYVLYEPRDLQYLKLVSDTLNFHYPNSKQAKALKANFEQEYLQSKINMVNDLMDKLPETKLDPSLKDLNGNRITLSSLRGKYVLLCFWSASSADCISENLMFKELYKKYKNKGFEIYQINIDIDANVWKKAVKFDELPWISVREDDPARPKTAILYNARVIPANYLYDREGTIVASNLHGKTLQLKLSQLFGN